MAREFSITDTRLQEAVAGFRGALAALRAPKPEARNELSGIEAERTALHGFQQQAWDMARERATARADAVRLGADDPQRLPGMNDYMVCAKSNAMRERVAASNPAVDWNNRSMVNFDGTTLRNVRLDADDLNRITDADRRALQQGATDFNPPPLDATYREEHEMTDEEIGELYAEVSNNAKCHHFENVHFHPADNINHYIKDHDAVVTNCTLDGLSDGHAIELGSGKYENLRVVDAKGGTLHLLPGARADHVDISGQTLSLTLDPNTYLSHLTATDASIVELRAAPSAEIANSSFIRTTISMSSELRGVKLTSAAFNDCNLDGLDLRGAILTNVTIDGQPATRELLESKGVTVDDSTRIHDPQFGRGADYERARAASYDQNDSYAKPGVMAALAQMRESIALPVEQVDLNSVALPREVAQMERNPVTVAMEQAKAAETALRMPGQ